MKVPFFKQCFIVTLFWCLAGSTAMSSHAEKVLVIHSYHHGFTWTDRIDGAIREILATEDEIEVSSEFLDSKRWQTEKVSSAFRQLLADKFAGARPDAIIVSDNNALSFMRQSDLFAGVPLIFCGINDFQPDLIQGLDRKITGVVEQTDPAGTVDLIQALQPDMERLAVITDTTETARLIKKETELALTGAPFPVLWQDGLSSQALFDFLKTLAPKDAVLLISFNRDRDGIYYSYEESAALISEKSAAPVYGLWDFYLGTGVVGGKMVHARDQGLTAARQCLAMLRAGRTPPVQTTSPNAWMVDFPAITAHGLQLDRLPPQTLIVNEPASFYQTHKTLIWWVTGFMALLIFMVIALLANIAQRRESEKKYKNLFELSMDAIFVIDRRLRVLDCNPSALRLFGIPSKEKFLNLSPPLDLAPEYQPDGQRSQDKARAIINEVMTQKVRTFEWRHRTADGRLFDASVLLSLVEIGGKTGLQATVRDISDQKQAQEMMIQSEKMMSVGGLAAGMAHEINNPLAGVIQNAAVMANRISDLSMPANQKAAQEAGTTTEAVARFMALRGIPKMITAITESGARMAGIVDNILSFARKGDTTHSAHDPVRLLDRVLDLVATDFDLKTRYDFKKIAVRKEYAQPLPVLVCEASKIQQVLLNILQNGAQAMASDPSCQAPAFVLRLVHEKTEGMLRIEIEDNGPGMDKETAKRVFEPFFTTKPIGVGTGLGLSVSYFIITENHRGTLTVSSEPGKGANFIIRLPAKE